MITINAYFYTAVCMLAGAGIVSSIALWYFLTRYSFMLDEDEEDEDGGGDQANWWKHPRSRNN